MRNKPNRARKHSLHIMLSDEEAATLSSWITTKKLESSSEAVRDWLLSLKKKLAKQSA